MNSFFLALATVLSYFSCSQKNKVDSKTVDDYRLEIVDSMRINHLAGAWIQDYDSISKHFVAVSRIDQELVIIDQKGLVSSFFVIPHEGPNSLAGIFSLSFKNAELQVFDSRNGFHFLSTEGAIKYKFTLPYSYIFVKQSIGETFYLFGKEMVYIRPERSDSLGGGPMGGLIKYMYDLPILEAYDTVAQKARHLMKFPKTSLYADGDYYFIPFPTVQKYGHRWYLHFARELKYFVFKEDGLDLILDKTVDLGVNDAILPVGVPFEALAEYSMSDQQAAKINQLYNFKGRTIVIYQKGVPQERVILSQTDPSIALIDKTFAAVFDTENELIKNDIPVPESLIFTRAITEKGEILAMKDQDYFGVEEDFVVYYKLKLLN